MAQKKQDEEFVEMLQQYEKLVFSVCYRMCNNYFDAEDLTQETFLAAYQAMDRFDGRNPAGFLTKIATNRCLDYIKKAERRTSAVSDDLLEAKMPSAPPPEKEILEQSVKEELIRACKSLKPPYDEVAKEYYYHGNTAAEIAEKTGNKLKTVQTQIRRAKQMLQKKIRKEELV